jgi:hypothetical protein
MNAGKYDNISLADYHAGPGWSKTSLDRIARSVAYYQECKKNPPDATQAMAFGAAFHCAVLTPALFQSSYAVSPSFDRRTTKGKQDYSAFQAENIGRTLISNEDNMTIQCMADAIRKHKLASAFLNDGEAEQSFFWTDHRTNLLCKVRPDYLRIDTNVCVELKTCEDATYKEFQRSIVKGRYHVQAAYFTDGIFGAIQTKIDDYVIIAIEKKAPYGIMVYRLDETSIEDGRIAYQDNLDRIVDWQANPEKYETVYPESESPVEITLPQWA